MLFRMSAGAIRARMMTIQRVTRVVVLLVLCLLATTLPARADLINYGDGLIYDTAQDLTWLDLSFDHPEHEWIVNSNCPFGCDYNYTWRGAFEWTGNLTYGGYDDWRLPHILGDWRGTSELMGMLGQIGWRFFDTDGHEIVNDAPYYPDTWVTGGQGPFLYPLQYWLAWTSTLYHYANPTAGGGYDFPDDISRDTGVIYAVREGAPTNRRVPEPPTVGVMVVGALIFGLRLRRRRVAG